MIVDFVCTTPEYEVSCFVNYPFETVVTDLFLLGVGLKSSSRRPDSAGVFFLVRADEITSLRECGTESSDLTLSSEEAGPKPVGSRDGTLVPVDDRLAPAPAAAVAPPPAGCCVPVSDMLFLPV